MRTKLIALLLLISVLFSAAAYAGNDVPSVTTQVIEIGKYSHALLDISIDAFQAAGFTLGDIVSVTAGSFSGDMPYLNGFYVDEGETVLRAYPGHTNIDVCINYGKFNELSGVEPGDEVMITLKEKAGALALQEINNLAYTENRDDYASDEIFANFRPVVAGDIAPGMLYRSASPVNNQYGRAPCAYKLFSEAGIRAVMNLADTDEELKARFSADDFFAVSYKDLYDNGSVIPLGLPVNFEAEEFIAGIVRGFTFLSGQEPPYLVHCTESKDRTGYACMLLEMLAGADTQEIIFDYMLSYTNYYGIEPGTDRYDYLAEKNIELMMASVAGLEKGRDLEHVIWQPVAESFLASHGMAPEAISALESMLAGYGAEALLPAA